MNDEQDAAKQYAESLGLHLIALDASRLAKQSDDGVIEFDKAAQQEITDKLWKLEGKSDLADAVSSLVHVAANLKFELGHEKAAGQLMAVAESAAFALQRKNAETGSGDEAARLAREGAARLAGEAPPKNTAPKYGEEAPADTIKLSTLLGPNRPIR